MDVTGSRTDQIPMLVSKEDQPKNSKCDKQMKVRCNENFQRPSWLKGNTKASSWPVQTSGKDFLSVDKENVDPRLPTTNIFNASNQFRQKQSSSPRKDSPSRRKWCHKVESGQKINMSNHFNSVDMEVDNPSPTTDIDVQDGFDNILNEDLVLDGGENDMLSVESSSTNASSASPACTIQRDITSGSPTVMSSLLSRRVVLNNTNEVSSTLKLLNDENGASPMLSSGIDFNPSTLTQSGANCNPRFACGRKEEIFSRFRRCASLLDQRQSPPIKGSNDLASDFTSPISRSSSGGQSSGFKRPLALRRPNSISADTSNLVPNKALHDYDASIEDHTFGTSLPQDYQQINHSNNGTSKRRKWDSSKCRPQLLKSHSMSAIGEESPIPSELSETQDFCLYRGPKDLGRRGARLIRSKSTIDPAAAEQIMAACSLAEFDPNRTGDTRRQLSLPVTQGHAKNEDLKNIDCHTMAKVLNGELGDKVARCRIIDARYCYEYEGGHIQGAENFGTWNEEIFLNEFFPPSLEAKILTPKPKNSVEDAIECNSQQGSNESEKREILVFHCEFSSARGPALMRLLRKKDRELNKATYPALHYPECYLLHDGYKAFYESYPHLCDGSYLPMKHPGFASEERRFHKKSKSWAAGGGGTVSRTGASSRLLKL